MAIIQWISTFTGKIMRAWAGRYRPERHYMRGAGPASKRSRAGALAHRRYPSTKRLRNTGAF
jgi:hypothetical protein